MANVIKTTFQLKRGIEQRWIEVNPILAQGEPGWAIDAHILKIGDGINPWNNLKAINNTEIKESDIQAAIDKYLQEHPIKFSTDKTLTLSDQAADSAAVRENCVFNTDQIIFYAGDADDNIF